MLTQARLKEVANYNPTTGIFIRRYGSGGKIKNSVMGCVTKKGYIRICIDRKSYMAQRLAFLYMEGYFPEYGVDHRNGIKSNNKWFNLRHATQACNLQNKKNLLINISGFVGVSQLPKGNWHARVQIKNKTIHLGTWSSKLEAALARLTWELNYPDWTCNYQNTIAKQIAKYWSGFKIKQIG